MISSTGEDILHCREKFGENTGQERVSRMYAKISSVEFLLGNEQEALEYIRERMFPSASVQAGFQDACIFQSATEPQKYTLMILWENWEKMQSSKLPDHLSAEQQHFETLIATFSQGTHELLFQFLERPEPEE